LFEKAHEENVKKADLEKKKAANETEMKHVVHNSWLNNLNIRASTLVSTSYGILTRYLHWRYSYVVTNK